MIKTKSELHFYLQEDARVNGIRSGLSYCIKLVYGNIGACVYRYLKSLRKYEYYTNIHSPLRFWYRFYNRRLGLKYNLSLPINKIGYGLYIPHIEGGVIVNCRQIGNLCTLNSGVVVGNRHTNEEVPTIGNNVVLSPKSTVIGAVTLGDNVIVAPNSVVIKDVPANGVVSGIPATVIRVR